MRQHPAYAIVLIGFVIANPAAAADGLNGKRLATQRCSSCHAVATSRPPTEVADSPPFEVIGQKYRFDVEQIAAAIRGVHPRMNIKLCARETEDIAAYIASLPR